MARTELLMLELIDPWIHILQRLKRTNKFYVYGCELNYIYRSILGESKEVKIVGLSLDK